MSLIKCVANGTFVVGEVLNLEAMDPTIHLVLLPRNEPGVYEFILADETTEEIHTDEDTPLVHTFATTSLQIHFHPRARSVDSCLCVALKGAIRCLQVDPLTNPRIGSLNSADLCATVTELIGEDRAALRFVGGSPWFSGFDEISSFSTSSEAETACVAKKSCHRWAGGKPVFTAGDVGFVEMVRLSNSDAMGWRRLAASFSTMMRYLQKLKADFCWSANSDNRTIIRLVCE